MFEGVSNGSDERIRTQVLAHRDAEGFFPLDLLLSVKLSRAHGALPYTAPCGLSSNDRRPSENFSCQLSGLSTFPVHVYERSAPAAFRQNSSEALRELLFFLVQDRPGEDKQSTSISMAAIIQATDHRPPTPCFRITTRYLYPPIIDALVCVWRNAVFRGRGSSIMNLLSPGSASQPSLSRHLYQS